jgi:hypothetical protein
MKKDPQPLVVTPNASARMRQLYKQNAAQTEEQSGDTQISKEVSKYSNDDAVKESGDNVMNRVREQVIERESKPATIRLSVDVSERMHERIKIYCATKRIPTTRALVIALLEAFLTEEGY